MRVGDILNRKSTRIATIRMNETVATAARLLRDEKHQRARRERRVLHGGQCRSWHVHGARRGARHRRARPGRIELESCRAGFPVQRLVSCRSTDPIDHVRDLMNDNHIRHLPVIDDHTLIGVISMRDINSSAGFGLIARPAAACRNRVCLTVLPAGRDHMHFPVV